jgi:hypothetical protein
MSTTRIKDVLCAYNQQKVSSNIRNNSRGRNGGIEAIAEE